MGAAIAGRGNAAGVAIVSSRKAGALGGGSSSELDQEKRETGASVAVGELHASVRVGRTRGRKPYAIVMIDLDWV